jgi:hypothetical protein
MKKLAFTITALIAFAFTTTAQNDVKKKDTPPASSEKKQAVNADGTPATIEKTNKQQAEEQKTQKSGTRMAINEKGLPAEKKIKKTNTPK